MTPRANSRMPPSDPYQPHLLYLVDLGGPIKSPLDPAETPGDALTSERGHVGSGDG